MSLFRTWWLVPDLSHATHTDGMIPALEMSIARPRKCLSDSHAFPDGKENPCLCGKYRELGKPVPELNDAEKAAKQKNKKSRTA